jgi:hypothetical protein
MIKLSPHFWLSSLLSEDGRSRERSRSRKTWSSLKKRYLVLKMKFRTLKFLKKRRDARRIRDKTDRWVRCIVMFLFLSLIVLLLTQCNGIKHIIEITEPIDHTVGDDGGKIKYKIIFGDKSQKE